MWEGGVRGAGLLWSPAVTQPGRVAPQMVHITDWLPTLMSAAGISFTLMLWYLLLMKYLCFHTGESVL